MNSGINKNKIEIQFNILLNQSMMQALVVIVFCIPAVFSAPAIDEDVRNLENNNIGDFNEVAEPILHKNHIESDPTAIPTIEEINQINNICMEETKTDRKIVDSVIIHQIIPTVPKYREFLACSYRKQKYLNSRGEIQFENIIRFLSKYYRRDDLKVLEVCGELKQTNNAGDNAYNVLKCILPKLYSLQEILDK